MFQKLPEKRLKNSSKEIFLELGHQWKVSIIKALGAIINYVDKQGEERRAGGGRGLTHMSTIQHKLMYYVVNLSSTMGEGFKNP